MPSNSNQNTIRERVEDAAVSGLGFIIGGVVGFLASLYGRFTANAAVDVRPNLADVGFIEAAVTNHAHDWLFYHYPIPMTVFTVLFGAVVIGVGWNAFGR